MSNGRDMRVSLSGTLVPESLDDFVQYARLLGSSGIIPKAYYYKDKNGKATDEVNIGAVIVAIQLGAECGLGTISSMRGIAVINGVPSFWGDVAKALVLRRDDVVRFEEEDIADIKEKGSATCTVQRKGFVPHSVTFTWEMAVKAGLDNKSGPWKQYPYRQMQMRARLFAMRDVWPDAFAGAGMVEEVRDYRSTEPAENIVKDALAPGLHSMKPPRQPQVEIEPAKPAPASIEEAIEETVGGPAEQPADETDWSLVGPPPMGEGGSDAEV